MQICLIGYIKKGSGAKYISAVSTIIHKLGTSINLPNSLLNILK
jgi:hypothetical protein